MPITGAGKLMLSSTMGAFSSQRVSPVRMSLKPTTAPMSPASNTSMGFCLFECIWKMRLMRSFLPERVFFTYEPAGNLPE